jgi:phosphohistidine phosphatase SixA
MKRFRFSRHSLKKGEFISKEGFDLIEAKKDLIPNVKKIFVSPYTRTIQTAAQMMAVIGQKKAEIVQLESIGNEKVWGTMLANDALMKAYASDPSQNIYELMRKHFSSEELIEIEKESAKAIVEIIENMEDGEECIAVGHAPYIKMAYNGAVEMGVIKGEKCYEDMAEMDFIDIEANF